MFLDRLKSDPRGFYIDVLTTRPILLLLGFLAICVRSETFVTLCICFGLSNSRIQVTLSVVAVVQPVSVDFGISSFEIRDHFTAVQWDAREQAANDYKQMLADLISSLGIAKKRSEIDQLTEDQGYEFSLNSALQKSWDGAWPMARSKREVSAERPQWSRRGKLHLVGQLPAIYDANGQPVKVGNVFERDNLYTLHDIYMKVISYDGYKSHCWYDYGENLCFTPETLMPFFFKKHEDDSSEVVDLTGTGQFLTHDLNRALGMIMQNQVWQLTDTNFSASNPRSTLMRFAFDWGTPLEGFNDANDRPSEQIASMRKWLGALAGMLRETREATKDNITVYFGFVHMCPFSFVFPNTFVIARSGDYITEMEIYSTIMSDAGFATGSLVLVFLFMWIHVESFFLSLMGIFQIMLSFPTHVSRFLSRCNLLTA